MIIMHVSWILNVNQSLQYHFMHQALLFWKQNCRSESILMRIWKPLQTEFIYCSTDEWMGHPLPNPLFFMIICRTMRIFPIMIGRSKARRGYKFSCGILQDIKYFMTIMMIFRWYLDILTWEEIHIYIYIYVYVCICDIYIYMYMYMWYIYTHTHICTFFFFSSNSILLTQVSSHYWPEYIYMHSFLVPSKSYLEWSSWLLSIELITFDWFCIAFCCCWTF